MSNNLGLEFAPILLTGDLITERMKLKNAMITVDDDDYNTINLSNFDGNSANFNDLFVNGNLIVGGDNVFFNSGNVHFKGNSIFSNSIRGENGEINVNSNLNVNGNFNLNANINVGVAVTISPSFIVVPLAIISRIAGQEADLTNILSNNITTNNLRSNYFNNYGAITCYNPNNSSDYFQLRPENDNFYIGGSNIVFNGQTGTHTATFDGFSRINIDDPLFVNNTITADNFNGNSIQLNNNNPVNNTNKLYNINGELYFNNKRLQEANIQGNFVPIIQQVSNDITKYQTSISYYLDFSPIGENQTLLYYTLRPYPTFSDLPSLLYLANAGNSSTHLQLYDTSSQRRVGFVDGHFTTLINDSSHKIRIYFSEKVNPQYNIYNGSSLVSFIEIEPDETIIFVYQQSFNHYFIASRTVNMEAFNVKLNNFSSIGTFTGSTITATNTTSANLFSNNSISTNANISNNLRVNNIISFTQPNISIIGDLILQNGNRILANAQPTSEDMLTNKRYVDSRHGGGNILENNNTWLGIQNFKQNIRLSDSKNLSVYNSAENQYLQLNPIISFTQNSTGTGYTIDGQNNTGDFIIQNYGHLRSVQPVKTNSITPIGGTLNIGSDNGLSTLNLATSDSTQIINLGTGIGATTINIGQPGDTINLNGNVNYTTVHDLAIFDRDIILNQGSIGEGSARGSGILIRDNNSNIAGRFIVNSLGTGYNLKAPEENREINIDLPNFNNGIIKCVGNTLSSSLLTKSDLPNSVAYRDEQNNFSQYVQVPYIITTQDNGSIFLRKSLQTNATFLSFQDASASNAYAVLEVCGSSGQSGAFTNQGAYDFNLGSYFSGGNVNIFHKSTSKKVSITNDGMTIFGNLIMGSNKMTSSYNVVNNNEIPNKLYVDSAIANASSFGNITASGLNSSGQIVTQATADAIKLMPTTTAHQFISFLDPPNNRFCYIGRPSNGSVYFDIGCQDQISTILRLQSGNGGANNIEIVSPINLGSNKIISSYTAVDNFDLPNKLYIDNKISSANVFGNTSIRTGNFAIDFINNSNPVLRDSITYPNSISLGNNNSFAWLQSWNSRPLKINSLGNSVHFGDGGVPITVAMYGGLTIYDTNNLNNYLQLNGSGILYSGSQNVSLDGQTSTTTLTFKNFNRVQIEDQLRIVDTHEAIQFRRPSDNSATYMTFRENSGISQYCYFGIESPSGVGIFGGTPNQLSFGTTTTNRVAFFQNNSRGSYLDSDNGYVYQYNRDGAPYKTWDNQIGTPAGRCRVRVFETTASSFSRNMGVSGTVLLQQPSFGNLTTGVLYGLSTPSSNNVMCISAHYIGLSAGLYCLEVTADDRCWGLINNFPFSINIFGTQSFPVYIYGGDCFIEITNINFNGGGECFFRLDLVYATTY